MDGGAAKPRDPAQVDPALGSDAKQPGDPAGAGAGAPQAGGAEPNGLPQNEALPVGKIAENQAVRDAAPKEEGAAAGAAVAVAPAEERQVGARGVPLGGQRGVEEGRADPAQAAKPKKEPLAALPKEEEAALDREKEKAEREKLEKKLEKERIDKEVEAAVEKERVERERREKVEREERAERARLEQERARLEQERVRLEQERAEKARLEREIARAEKELAREKELVRERAEKEKELEEQGARLAEQKRAVQAQEAAGAGAGAGAGAQGGGEPQSAAKGGRDLKGRAARRVNPRGGAEEQASQEKARDQGDTDLRRRRRALGAGETGGGGEALGSRGLGNPLDLGGPELHAALQGQLLAGGALVHSRQIKQTADSEGE